MLFRRLDGSTVELYLAYLKRAMQEEPEEMMADCLDEEGIRRRIADPFFQRTTSLLAMEEGFVIGRIEYHFYGCLQDGYRMAYVDWVYVLPEYRHKGVAQGLFRTFEEDCIDHGIDQYYLIRSENEAADRFYHACGAELTHEPLLRKRISVGG